MSELADISFIKKLAGEYGFSFHRKLGQNFIADPSVCPRIALRAGVDEKSCVLEIGAGIGTLTRALAQRAKKVVTLEVDRTLQPILEKTLAGYDNVSVVFGDVLDTDLPSLCGREFGADKVKVRANLPYNITSPVVMKLLSEDYRRESITVMVQKEAAERLCAPPGTRQCGAVSLAVSYYSVPKFCFGVPSSSFYPRPGVDSSVINLAIREKKPVYPKDEGNMFRLIKAAFGQRRKTLPNALLPLGIEKEDMKKALLSLGLDPACRAETLTLGDFARLSDILMPPRPEGGKQ